MPEGLLQNLLPGGRGRVAGNVEKPGRGGARLAAVLPPHAGERHEDGPPTLGFTSTTGLRYAVSLDDEAPQIIHLHTGFNPDNGNRPWEQGVAENIVVKSSQHAVAAAGPHVLKFWRVDAGAVLEKLVISQGAVPASYLGPPRNVAAPAPKGNLGGR
ncbi:MAG: hypothetical protein ACRYFR_12115 [Janthinobacterium lividum]